MPHRGTIRQEIHYPTVPLSGEVNTNQEFEFTAEEMIRGGIELPEGHGEKLTFTYRGKAANGDMIWQEKTLPVLMIFVAPTWECMDFCLGTVTTERISDEEP